MKVWDFSLDKTICFLHNRFGSCNDSFVRFSSMTKPVVVMKIVHAVVFGVVLRICNTEAELHQQVTVDCDFDQMQVHIEKSLIPEFEMRDVRLLDPNCQPTKSENSSHMTVTAPLIGCGTTLEHTKDSLIYRNMIKDARVTQSIISRLQDLEIPFECAYPNQAEASLIQMNITNTKVIFLAPQDGSGMFDLDLNIYKSEDYDEEYISFPLAVTLQQRLYLQVSVDTPDTRLGIVADTCYATPINSISKKIKYDIIVDRCQKDETVRFHNGPPTTQRFSIEAFQFLNGQVMPYVYIHCEVVLCNLTDDKPSCMQKCEPHVNTKLRREVNTDYYDLEKGPIVILRDPEDNFEADNAEELRENQDYGLTNMTTWLFVVMGCVCVICFGAVLHTIKEVNQAK